MNKLARVSILLLLGAVLSACNFSGGPKADKDALSAWIDKPLDGSTHVLGTIEILGHGAAYKDISSLELSYLYNNAPERTIIGSTPPEIINTKPGSGPSTVGVLARAKWSWVPPTVGTYLLNLRAQRGDGAWSDYGEALIQVTMPDLPIGGLIQPEPGQGPQPVSSPTLPSTATPTAEPACINQAKFIADITIPDNTNLAPGAAFTKTWHLQNSGTCAWDENYKVVFTNGAPMSNPTPISVPGIVAPGATVDISLNLVAPGSPGTYKGDYQLRSPENEHFGVGTNGGVPFYVQIVVGATPTPMPQADSQPPHASISHSPPGTSLPEFQWTTFNVVASDNVGVTKIEIYIQLGAARGSLVQTCNNTTTCSYQNGYGPGTVYYSARVYDAANNQVVAPGQTITYYVVVK